MPGLSPTGLDVPTLDEIKAEIEAAARAEIDPRLDLSESSPMGQFSAIVSRQIRKVWEALEALYAAADPDGATGQSLDRIAALTGTDRRPATASRVTATVNVDPGTYPAGSLVAHVTGRPSARFANADVVTNGGASPANATAVFVAETTGPVLAPSGTLVEIASPVAGWNSVTNDADATPGSAAETDPQLRVRRAREVQGIGSTTVDAIRSAISRLSGVLEVFVFENDTDTTDVNGIPPHAFEAVIYGPDPASAADDAAAAAAIFSEKPAGILAAGSTVETVTDSQGVTHQISFTRPTDVDVGIAIDVDVFNSDYAGDSEVQAAILAGFAAAQGVGDDVRWSRVASWAHGVRGVLAVTDVRLGPAAGPLVSLADVPITIRQIAKLASGDVAVSSTVTEP